MDLSALDPRLVPVLLIGFFGAAVQGMSGFGFGLVCMSLLPLLLPVDQAVPLVAGVGFTLTMHLGWRLRRHLSFRRAVPLILGGAVGTPLGIAFLQGADPRLVRGLLGAVILSYAVYALTRRADAVRERPPSVGVGMVAGLCGGVLGGAFNTGGPPAVVYVSAMGWQKDAATSTLQAFFLFGSLFTVSGHLAVGNFDAPVQAMLWPLLPAAWAGSILGARIYDRVPQARFQRLVLVMLLVLGANFLVRAVLDA